MFDFDTLPTRMRQVLHSMGATARPDHYREDMPMIRVLASAEDWQKAKGVPIGDFVTQFYLEYGGDFDGQPFADETDLGGWIGDQVRARQKPYVEMARFVGGRAVVVTKKGQPTAVHGVPLWGQFDLYLDVDEKSPSHPKNRKKAK